MTNAINDFKKIDITFDFTGMRQTPHDIQRN